MTRLRFEFPGGTLELTLASDTARATPITVDTHAEELRPGLAKAQRVLAQVVPFRKAVG